MFPSPAPSEKNPEEIPSLKRAIHALEAQRPTLGDHVINAALAPLLERLRLLNEVQEEAPRQGERKIVTVVFADLSGFTALSASTDAEVVRDLVISVFDRLAPLVKKYDGMIEKFIGDEILAIFGAPVEHENDPERALRCALDMLAELNRINQERGLELGLHFGIDTGPVVAGSIGSRAEAGYGVVGDIVNVAARLEDASPRGQILVGADTYKATAARFIFEEIAPLVIQGKSEPVGVYRLLGVKPGLVKTHSLEGQAGSSAMIGREREKSIFQGCLQRLKIGQGGVLCVLGEAGLGKSRLVAEIRQTGEAENLCWLEGRTISFSQSLSYWPFLEIFRQLADITEEDGVTTAWSKLEKRVKGLFPEGAEELLPYLASLLAIPVKSEYEERVKYLDGEAMRRQIFLAVYRFFERLARTYPTVLVFEDLHWADQSSLALLEHLLSLVGSVPLLVCGVSRLDPESASAHWFEAAGRDHAAHYQEIRLEPLSQAESAELALNLLAVENLPAEFRKSIQSKAEGNPFFIEEVVRSLIEAGAVKPDPNTGAWQVTDRIEEFTVPDTIQGVIMARIDRLDEEVKHVLRIAAVIGRTFLYRLLRAIDEFDQDLDRNLEELKMLELIREKSRVVELEYIFKHALTQEATYESILKRERRELHASVGHCLESLFCNRLESFYSLLAYHFARAEEWGKAQEYLIKAGDQASHMAADAEVLACYRQAMEAYGRAFGESWDPVQRAALERKMGEALFHRGETAEAIANFEKALKRLGGSLPISGGPLILQTAGEVIRQVAHRLYPQRFVRPGVARVSSALEEKVRIYERLGAFDAMNYVNRFIWDTLVLLNESENGGYAYGMIVGSAALGTVFDIIPLPGIAEKLHRRALRLAEQSRHPIALGRACNLMGIHELIMARMDTAASYGLRAAEIYRQAGNLWDWYVSIHQSVLPALGFQGKIAQTLCLSQEVVKMGQETGDLQAQEMGIGLQGSVYRRLGRLEEAFPLCTQAVELDAVTEDAYMGSIFYAELGRCYLARGELNKALENLDKGLVIWKTHPLRGASATYLYNGLAEAYLWAMENSPLDEKERWRKLAKWACRETLKQGHFIHVGAAEGMRLQGTYKWLRGDKRAALKYWKRSRDFADKTGQFFDLALTLLEMGRRLGEGQFLQQGENILSAMAANKTA